MNREYAEKFSERWVILSAKHGYIDPDFIIPENYNVTFKNLKTSPVTTSILVQQIKDQDLVRYPIVIGLGGKEYRKRIQESFKSYDINVKFPFAVPGLRMGETMSRIKKAIAQGNMEME